eukprot:RCo013354
MPIPPMEPPRYSQWQMYRRMQRLARSGTCRLPEWYYAMRVAPPPTKAYNDPTRAVRADRSAEAHRKVSAFLKQRAGEHNTGSPTAERVDFGAASRGVVQDFRMEKPVEALVRHYEALRKNGVAEEAALQAVGDDYMNVMKVLQRQHQIMTYQAKKDGTSLSIREARGVLRALDWVASREGQLADRQYQEMEEAIKRKIVDDMKRAQGFDSDGASAEVREKMFTIASSSASV